MVLRAVVSGYVAEASPTSSATVSHLLPVSLSSASIRTTMAELAALGLLEKPHASAGRIPTESGLRVFVDHLLEQSSLGEYDRRALADELEGAGDDDVMPRISDLLSRRTHQLGFALRPRLERIVLRHVSLVRVAESRLLVVLVPRAGAIVQRVIDDDGRDDQSVLDRMARDLNARVAGRTLSEVRVAIERELGDLEREARGLLFRSLALGLRIFGGAGQADDAELVITTRSALLSQPEFDDPERVRALMSAIETKERLVAVLERVLETGEISLSLGEALDEPALRSFSVVAVPYGRSAHGHAEADEPDDASGAEPLGVLGVIGPSRMDYARVIPLVSYCSQLVTRKLGA